jgi:subtilase family serine protease
MTSSKFCLDPLESRQLLSLPPGLSPHEIRHAYGLDHVLFSNSKHPIHANGAGQTIAIVDAYDAPNIAHDLRVFSKTFNLPTKDANGNFVLSKVTTRRTPSVDAGWALEISLDVEWAHAIAPRAHILLVEAASPSNDNLLNAIDYARRQKGVSLTEPGGVESPHSNSITTTPRPPAPRVGGEPAARHLRLSLRAMRAAGELAVSNGRWRHHTDSMAQERQLGECLAG